MPTNMDDVSEGICAQCDATNVPLLACDDPDGRFGGGKMKPRFCNECMIGKKVRVFWPVDSSWYTGTVKQYDPASGEHLLEYHDGDTEWVKIGENNTTGAGASPSGVEAEDLKRDRSEMMMHHPAERQHPHHSKWSTAITTTGAAGDGAPSPPSGYGPPPGNPYYPPSAGPYGGHPSPPSHPPPPPGAGGAANGGGGPPYGVPPSMMPPPYGMMYPVPYGAPPMYQGYGGAGPPGGPGGSHAPHKTEEKSPTGSADGGFGKRKTGPKAWSKHEDELLLNIVHSMQWPMKWTVVAQSLPDRTGKQCRERYVNHLNPRLKVSDWSLQEDATVFHLYNLIGSHWAKMSKIIPGRTDNGIKNRFHNIRRQYEREDEHRLRLSSSKDFPEEIRLSRLRPMPKHLLGNSAKLWDMEAAIGVLAAQSVLDGNSTTNRGSAGRFGPFRQPQAGGELCVRCGFMVPSLQTGREICSKTGWCQSCTLIPPHASGNFLRECLSLRRCQDPARRAIIESWEELFHGGGLNKDKKEEEEKKGHDNSHRDVASPVPPSDSLDKGKENEESKENDDADVAMKQDAEEKVGKQEVEA